MSSAPEAKSSSGRGSFHVKNRAFLAEAKRPRLIPRQQHSHWPDGSWERR
jgi:hypothetical protein